MNVLTGAYSPFGVSTIIFKSELLFSIPPSNPSHDITNPLFDLTHFAASTKFCEFPLAEIKTTISPFL